MGQPKVTDYDAGGEDPKAAGSRVAALVQQAQELSKRQRLQDIV